MFWTYITVALGVYGLYLLLKFVYDLVNSPLRYLPGPSNPSLLLGWFKELEKVVSIPTTPYTKADRLTQHLQC